MKKAEQKRGRQKEVDLRHYLTEHDKILVRGGRSGQFMHLAYSGSSCTDCGHWLRHSAKTFKVAAHTVRVDRLCAKCFTPKMLDKIGRAACPHSG